MYWDPRALRHERVTTLQRVRGTRSGGVSIPDPPWLSHWISVLFYAPSPNENKTGGLFALASRSPRPFHLVSNWHNYPTPSTCSTELRGSHGGLLLNFLNSTIQFYRRRNVEKGTTGRHLPTNLNQKLVDRIYELRPVRGGAAGDEYGAVDSHLTTSLQDTQNLLTLLQVHRTLWFLAYSIDRIHSPRLSPQQIQVPPPASRFHKFDRSRSRDRGEGGKFEVATEFEYSPVHSGATTIYASVMRIQAEIDVEGETICKLWYSKTPR